MNASDAQRVLEAAECLFDSKQVTRVIKNMADAITRDLADSDPLVLCIMTGALIPAGQLLTLLDFQLQMDYVHATRYRGETTGGRLHWIVRPTHSLKDRTVLIIDDIYDVGITLGEIIEYCWSEGARDVSTAVLVNKLHDRKQPLQINYIGLETDDRYLFGYGMDYHGYLRNVPGIYAVQE